MSDLLAVLKESRAKLLSKLESHECIALNVYVRNVAAMAKGEPHEFHADLLAALLSEDGMGVAAALQASIALTSGMLTTRELEQHAFNGRKG